MKVSVYKEEGDTFALMVEASLGKGRAPVLTKGVPREGISSWVLQAVNTARGPKQSSLP